MSATQQAYNQAKSATAELANQYKEGQAATTQLKAKQSELRTSFEQSQSATSQLKDKLGGLKIEAAKFKSSGAVDEYKRLQNQIKAKCEKVWRHKVLIREIL